MKAETFIGQYMNIKNPRTGTWTKCKIAAAKFVYGKLRVSFFAESDPVWFIPTQDEINQVRAS